MGFLSKMLHWHSEEPVEIKIKSFNTIDMSQYPSSGQSAHIFHIEVYGDAQRLAAALDKYLSEEMKYDTEGLGMATAKGREIIHIYVPDALILPVREALNKLKRQTPADESAYRIY